MANTLTPTQQAQAAGVYAQQRYGAANNNAVAVLPADQLAAGVAAADTWLTANVGTAVTAITVAVPGITNTEARHILRYTIEKILGVI